jgi:hypothetical protein
MPTEKLLRKEKEFKKKETPTMNSKASNANYGTDSDSARKASDVFYGTHTEEGRKAFKTSLHGLSDAMTKIQNARDLPDSEREALEDDLVHAIHTHFSDNPDDADALISSIVNRVTKRDELSDDDVEKLNTKERLATMASMRERYGKDTDRLREKAGKYPTKVFGGNPELKRAVVVNNLQWDPRFAEIVFERARKGDI